MKKKSGGVAVTYKKCLEQCFESDSKLVQWFYLSDTVKILKIRVQKILL